MSKSREPSCSWERKLRNFASVMIKVKGSCWLIWAQSACFVITRRAQGGPMWKPALPPPHSHSTWSVTGISHLIAALWVRRILETCAELCMPARHSEMLFVTDVTVNSLLRDLNAFDIQTLNNSIVFQEATPTMPCPPHPFGLS